MARNTNKRIKKGDIVFLTKGTFYFGLLNSSAPRSVSALNFNKNSKFLVLKNFSRKLTYPECKWFSFCEVYSLDRKIVFEAPKSAFKKKKVT